VTADGAGDIAAQVAAELADPTGGRLMSATVAVGDLSDQAALDALRAGIVAACPAMAPGPAPDRRVPGTAPAGPEGPVSGY
jgi:hypothetical protein